MTFFNKKEEVLDIQLTQYGRELLAKGKLKPKYYAFYDDDILYDSEYAGYTESQNEIEPRIQEDSVSLRTQASFEGAEFSSRTEVEMQSTANRHYSLAHPLGTSTISTQYRPAWDIKFLKNDISGSTSALTGSHQVVNIPQITVDVEYKIFTRDSATEPPVDSTIVRTLNENDIFAADRALLRSRIFPDGTYLEVRQDPILLDVFEHNTDFETENVMIEFFEIESVDVAGRIQTPGIATSEVTKKQVLNPVRMRPKYSNIVNNLLVDDLPNDVENIELDPNYIEYYMDVLVDKEIPAEEMCEGLNNLRSRGVDIDDAFIEFDCPEKQPQTQQRMDIYATNVIEGSDPAEDCGEVENCQE